ncbi:hypothetical protein B6N13_05445 [Marinomonas sp. UCMA 3892]|uniref:deaminase n=1 Tax=unclassified Marinomonas TaxID=196814 RepID=UPI00146BC4C8|nr:deaminase [Marinomonas sp. UCMA 3892]NLU97548.1 hypothetical protein [Marinomonas sp. UCMA 3892]
MRDNQYSELVFGLTAPIGVNCSIIIEELERQIEFHNWRPHLINTSALVLNELQFIDSREQEKGLTAFRIASKQAKYTEEIGKGASLTSINSALIIDYIKSQREKQRGFCLDKGAYGVVYIINMLIDDKDSEQLREFYEHGYFQIGITDSEVNRKKNLDKLFKAGSYNTTYEQNFARHVAERIDKKEIEKVFIHSDFFIDASENRNDKIERFIDLIFGAPNISPTHSEFSMFMAFMASVDSADLSRQVGAVISSQNNDIVATGSNDVQKAGGGKYWPDEVYEPLGNENFGMFCDKRDAAIGYDANANTISQLSADIAKTLLKQIPEISNVEQKELENVLRNKTGLKDITEFGRIVHAELSAIMSALRNGVRVQGGQLSCTTFPCHNCAKHIVASGIKRVEYIEPYPKSKALDLHKDSISMGEEGSDKVVFSAFTGVGPSRFLDLFSTMGLGAAKKIKRKTEDGKAIPTERGKYCHPRVPVSLDKQCYLEDRTEVFKCMSIAKAISNKPEDIFEKTYSSYIKIFNNKSPVVIERVKELATDYPLDYMFSMQILDEDLSSKIFKGLRVKFKLKPGTTRLLLAHSIELMKVKRIDGEHVIGECIGIARRSTDGVNWYIDKVIESHPSNYLIKDLKGIAPYINEKTEIQVSFTLVHNSQGMPYEAKMVDLYKGF